MRAWTFYVRLATRSRAEASSVCHRATREPERARESGSTGGAGAKTTSGTTHFSTFTTHAPETDRLSGEGVMRSVVRTSGSGSQARPLGQTTGCARLSSPRTCGSSVYTRHPLVQLAHDPDEALCGRAILSAQGKRATGTTQGSRATPPARWITFPLPHRSRPAHSARSLSSDASRICPCNLRPSAIGRGWSNCFKPGASHARRQLDPSQSIASGSPADAIAASLADPREKTNLLR